MSRGETQASAPTARFFVEIFALGVALSIGLVLLSPPLWVVYIAPLAAVPLLLKELRRLSCEEQLKAGVPIDDRSIEIEKLAADLVELRVAARQAQTKRERATLRARQLEFETSRLRYERRALVLGVVVGMAVATLGTIVTVLSWKNEIAVGVLAAMGITAYLLKSHIWGDWPPPRARMPHDLEMQEARIEDEPEIDAMSSGRHRTSRPD